jgi:hypothetical protein
MSSGSYAIPGATAPATVTVATDLRRHDRPAPAERDRLSAAIDDREASQQRLDTVLAAAPPTSPRNPRLGTPPDHSEGGSGG